jgi:uncharacterized protein YfaS (alpha-2-macroglobulin family)
MDELEADMQQSLNGTITLGNERSVTKSEDAPKMDSKKESGKYKNGDDKTYGELLSGKDERDGNFVEAETRSDFKDAMYWSPAVTTDASGYATVSVKYPDNLTAWRITSRVITEDTKVGQEVNTVITRKDLLVRMETPRFFQQNDEGSWALMRPSGTEPVVRYYAEASSIEEVEQLIECGKQWTSATGK